MTHTPANPNTYPLAKTVLSRAATEVTTAWPGYWLLSFIPRKDLAGFLGRHVVEPNLEKCEALIDQYLPAIETKEDRAHRATLSRKERAARIASELADQSVESVGNFVIQMYGQQGFDHVFHAAQHELTQRQQATVVFADRAMQVGSVVLLNTLLTRPNIEVQKFISNLYQRYFHVPPEEADDRATRVLNERVPSLMGLIASVYTHRAQALRS